VRRGGCTAVAGVEGVVAGQLAGDRRSTALGCELRCCWLTLPLAWLVSCTGGVGRVGSCACRGVLGACSISEGQWVVGVAMCTPQQAQVSGCRGIFGKSGVSQRAQLVRCTLLCLLFCFALMRHAASCDVLMCHEHASHRCALPCHTGVLFAMYGCVLPVFGCYAKRYNYIN
jgi:hypothetical protein